MSLFALYILIRIERISVRIVIYSAGGVGSIAINYTDQTYKSS